MDGICRLMLRPTVQKVRNFPGGSEGKESAHNVEDLGLIPRWGRSPGEGQPTPVFLPRESHGQRSLVGYSPWGHKESDKNSSSFVVATIQI